MPLYFKVLCFTTKYSSFLPQRLKGNITAFFVSSHSTCSRSTNCFSILWENTFRGIKSDNPVVSKIFFLICFFIFLLYVLFCLDNFKHLQPYHHFFMGSCFYHSVLMGGVQLEMTGKKFLSIFLSQVRKTAISLTASINNVTPIYTFSF